MPTPSSSGPLEPGTYIDTSLGVELTLTVPEGWEIANEPVVGVGVDLTTTGFVPAGSQGVAFLGFVRFDGDVFRGPLPAPGMDPASCLEQSAPTERSAQALVDHLVANPYLVTTEPETRRDRRTQRPPPRRDRQRRGRMCHAGVASLRHRCVRLLGGQGRHVIAIRRPRRR